MQPPAGYRGEQVRLRAAGDMVSPYGLTSFSARRLKACPQELRATVGYNSQGRPVVGHRNLPLAVVSAAADPCRECNSFSVSRTGKTSLHSKTCIAAGATGASSMQPGCVQHSKTSSPRGPAALLQHSIAVSVQAHLMVCRWSKTKPDTLC